MSHARLLTALLVASSAGLSACDLDPTTGAILGAAVQVAAHELTKDPPAGATGGVPGGGAPTPGTSGGTSGGMPAGTPEGAPEVTPGDTPGDAPAGTLPALPAGLPMDRVDVALGADRASVQQGLQMHLAARAGGGGWLAWDTYAGQAATIVPFGADLRPTGPGFKTPDGAVVSMMGTPDGGLVVLLAGPDPVFRQTPDYRPEHDRLVANLVAYDARGAIRWQTRLMGGEGLGPGKDSIDRDFGSLATDGTNVGVLMGMFHNWAEPGEADDIHQADVFFRVDDRGRVDAGATRRWNSSHSFDPRLAVGPAGDFRGLTTGDAYPYGVPYYNFSLEAGDGDLTRSVVWPAEGWEPPEEAIGVNWAVGRMGGFDVIGETGYGVLSTAEHPYFKGHGGGDRGILLLAIDARGTRKSQTWLRDPAPGQEAVWSVRIGDGDLLVGWGAYGDTGVHEAPMTLGRVDPATGAFRQPPTKVDGPFSFYFNARPVRTADGAAVFVLQSPADPTHALLHRVRP